MKLDRRYRRVLRLQNAVFTLLLAAAIVLAAWLSQRYVYTADWTAAGRNTLASQSADAVELFEGPIQATAYLGPEPLPRERLRDLLARYDRAGAEIELEFINPETNPALARELGIRDGGELILRYGEQEQRLQQVSEQTVTNALLSMARGTTRWIAFLQGHGERDPHGEANFELGTFSERLSERGLRVQTLNLAGTGRIPDNTDVLVLASPRADYLPGEVAMIRQYVRDGGHLLWLTEPGNDAAMSGRLDALRADLGVRRISGVVVDPAAQMFGADTPDFAVIARYGDHPAAGDLGAATLFPQATALEPAEGQGWQHHLLLQSRPDSWAETGPIRGEVSLDADAGDTPGPLTLGFAATRGQPAGEDSAEGGQRIAVIGDGDFLSNAYLGNGANLDLGMRLINWLAGDDAQVQIASGQPADAGLNMSRTALAIIGLGFLLVLPLGLLTAGGVIAYRRRRR
ncbi:MAG: GldG family protein [Halofilum sp. (in: g-proteobacteria)]